MGIPISARPNLAIPYASRCIAVRALSPSGCVRLQRRKFFLVRLYALVERLLIRRNHFLYAMVKVKDILKYYPSGRFEIYVPKRLLYRVRAPKPGERDKRVFYGRPIARWWREAEDRVVSWLGVPSDDGQGEKGYDLADGYDYRRGVYFDVKYTGDIGSGGKDTFKLITSRQQLLFILNAAGRNGYYYMVDKYGDEAYLIARLLWNLNIRYHRRAKKRE